MEIAGIEPSPFGSEGYGLPYVREQQKWSYHHSKMLGLKKEGGEDFGSILRLRVDAVRYENNRNDLTIIILTPMLA